MGNKSSWVVATLLLRAIWFVESVVVIYHGGCLAIPFYKF